MADEEGRHHHFLLVTFGIQSHINPARALAHRLTRLGVGGGSIHATLCLPEATHRRIFPSSSSSSSETATDGVISYVPYSDGHENGSFSTDDEARARSRRAAFESLSSVASSLAARGRPVTCIMCTMVLLSVVDVASELGVPLAVFWIQPAHILAAFYHYSHGYGDLIASRAAAAAGDPSAEREVSLPGLSRPLRIRDFPTFLVDTTGSALSRVLKDAMRELFEYTDRRRPKVKVLVNTFDALEPAVLAEMRRHLDVLAVGPVVGSATEARLHLFEHGDADRKRYMNWLDAQPEKSVVYVSFGSISKYKKWQMEEVVQGLQRCGRPYLLVVRKDGLDEEDDAIAVMETTLQGMVVEWCNQLEVLSHTAVGCFVSHCGWNSTLEAVVCGVPMVCAPNMFDQPTTAYLVEEEWQIGTKVKRNNDGVLTGTELARCIDVIMGEGATAGVIRERTEALKGIAQEVAAVEGAHAERNLLDFVKTI